MRKRLFTPSIITLVVGCLLIAYSDRPNSLAAILGYVGVILALALFILGFFHKAGPPPEPSIGEEEARSLRQEFSKNGRVSAVRRLRGMYPHLSISDASRALDDLVE